MGEVGIDRSIVVPMPYHVTMGEIRDFRLQIADRQKNHYHYPRNLHQQD